MPSPSFNLADAPSELAKIYADAYASALRQGANAEESEKVAFRTIQHSGWYQTGSGWKRLGPDVRNKVNLRRAELQPDGRFLIRDVDVFYPNAVKGTDETYDPAQIRTIIANTNRMIESGAQPPALLNQHPTPMQKMIGVVLPVFGEAMNWAESDKGEGWVKCDLLADSAIVDGWKKGQVTGASAGIYPDSAKLNPRFGHVAALGAETQALSLLPRTTIFSAFNAEAAEPCVCFSAEPQKGNSIMSMPDGKKACYAAMKTYCAAKAAAFASMECGEPDAGSKMKEASAMYAAGKTQFGADWDMNDTGSETDMAMTDAPLSPDTAGEGEMYEAGGVTATKAPEETHEEPGAVGHFSADAQAVIDQLKGRLDKASLESKKMNNMLAIMVQQGRRDDIKAFTAGLKSEGHHFDADGAGKMFDAAIDSPALIAQVKEFLRRSPKQLTPSRVGTVVGIEGNERLFSANGDSGSDAGAIAALQQLMPNKAFDQKAIQAALRLSQIR